MQNFKLLAFLLLEIRRQEISPQDISSRFDIYTPRNRANFEKKVIFYA